MTDTDADAIMQFADRLLPGDGQFPAASAAGMRALLLPRLAPHADALLAALAAGTDPARMEADAPDLFEDVRKIIFLTYYEQEPVIAAIRDLGAPYNWAPLPEGYAPEPFSPVIDAPRHRRGAWVRTEDVTRVDLSGLDHLEDTDAMSKPEHSDILVIGAGASGAILSLVLAQRGLKVVCLDQGGWTAPADHPHYDKDFQWQRQKDWSPEPNIRQADADYPVDTKQSHALMWNGVGGSTNVFGALWPRYRPSDFRKGTEHGLAPDWPLTYEDLAPFYDESDRLVGVSGLSGDLAMPPRPAYPCGPLAMRASGRAIAGGFERLGWHWWPMPAAIISENYDGRAACNGCGNCGSGCPRGSMAKFSLTMWPRALAAGATLRPGARVERIETDAAGRATGAVYIDRATGQRHIQTADITILAANGVGSPRTLLLSKSARFPNGLANGNDVVGRYLMHHTLVAASIWVEEPIRSHIGNSGAVISCEFAETDTSRGFVNGFNFNVARGGAAAGVALGSFANQPLPWGADHHAEFRRRFGHGFGAFAIGDDLPQASNRITLSATETDNTGLPAAKLNYIPHANDWKMMHYAIERLHDLAGAVGAFDHAINTYCDPDGTYRTPAWHLLGTCRMGNDPETSVTTKWHQTWEVPNLYVIDGSSVVTGGVCNPTSTVCALALRAGRHIADSFADLRRTTRPIAA